MIWDLLFFFLGGIKPNYDLGSDCYYKYFFKELSQKPTRAKLSLITNFFKKNCHSKQNIKRKGCSFSLDYLIYCIRYKKKTCLLLSSNLTLLTLTMVKPRMNKDPSCLVPSKTDLSPIITVSSSLPCVCTVPKMVSLTISMWLIMALMLSEAQV